MLYCTMTHLELFFNCHLKLIRSEAQMLVYSLNVAYNFYATMCS